MRPTRKTVVTVSLILVLLLIALCLALPPLARHLAVQKIEEATGRKTEIAQVSFNPFTLSARISGFRLAERGAPGTFVSFSSARLSLSPLSLPRRAFIVKEIAVVSPYLHLVRSAPNTFNFSDLMTGKKEPKKQESYLFSLNNITLTRGSVDFQDKALAAERDHQLRDLALAIPFYSNIPYLADRYVTPHFSATLNGTRIALDGRLKPLTRAVEATLDLKFKDLDLPFYLGYLPFPPPVRVESGRFSSTLELGYRVDAKAGPEATLAGTLSLDRLAVREPGGAQLANLSRAELAIKRAALIAKRFELSALKLDQPELFVARDAAGKWNFQKITVPPTGAGARSSGQGGASPPGAAPEAKGGASQEPGKKAASGSKDASKEEPKRQPLALELASLQLKGGRVHLVDAMPAGGFRTDLKEIDFELSRFSTAAGARAPFSFGLASARGEKLAAKGDLVAAPAEIAAQLTLSGVPLKDYFPYLRGTLAAPVTGTVGLASLLRYSEPGGLVLEKTSLKAENLAASWGSGEGIRIREFLAGEIQVGLKENKALVGSVELKGGNLALSREPDGKISAVRLLKPPAPAAPKPRQRRQVAKEEQKKQAPFAYRVNRVTGSDLGVRFTDRTREEPPVFTLSRLRFNLTGIAGPKQGPIPFTLASGYGRKGSISASGSLNPSPLRLKGKVALQGIALRDFDGYLPEGTEIFLADGTLETRLALDLTQGPSGIGGSFNGSLGVQSFYCQETVYDEDLLKWDSLQLDQVAGTISPFTLAIRDVSLSNFYARVIVEPDGTLNLQHLVRQEPAAGAGAGASTGAGASAGASTASAGARANAGAGAAAPGQTGQTGPTASAAKGAPAPAASGASPAQPHPIRIETVTMQGGTLDFSDHHLKSPFDTTFYNLGGRVSGLTSEANRAADVDLRGNLENHSPLSITGRINPLRGDLYLDLKIAFTDIELSPFTPYANTYLGYSVDKGKLNLDLAYKIDKKSLTSSNKLFIDQFTFGKQVASDKATKLPVRLAVALLKDRKGEIHLDLPVVGQTDDPKFSIGKVILQILKNLLVKAATSPFALLGSLFGGGEDFSAIAFAPGSARLPSPEEAKLAKLSQALADRPALNIEISGFVDRDRDAEGYRGELLTRKMKGEKFRALVKEGKARPGQTPEDTELTPQEVPVYLKAVYAKEKFPKPRNVLGIAKDLPEPEMRKLIITHTQVGPNELETLARERAEAVRDYLLKSGKLAPQRLFEKKADIFKPPAKEGAVASRVEFGAVVK